MCHPVAKLQDSLGLQQDPNDPMWPIVNGAPAHLRKNWQFWPCRPCACSLLHTGMRVVQLRHMCARHMRLSY